MKTNNRNQKEKAVDYMDHPIYEEVLGKKAGKLKVKDHSSHSGEGSWILFIFVIAVIFAIIIRF